jgi:hypothetical protein
MQAGRPAFGGDGLAGSGGSSSGGHQAQAQAAAGQGGLSAHSMAPVMQQQLAAVAAAMSTGPVKPAGALHPGVFGSLGSLDEDLVLGGDISSQQLQELLAHSQGYDGAAAAQMPQQDCSRSCWISSALLRQCTQQHPTPS